MIPVARSWWLQLALATLLIGSSSGGKIIWRSLARPHVDSQHQSLTREAVFQLGVFTEGFVPTLSNTAQWALHWHVAAETSYDEIEGRFSDTFVVSNDVSPFRSGTRGYV